MMNHQVEKLPNKWVRNWLILGLILVLCQIIIGGITRLTGSGLSITEWEIVTGTLPPLNAQAWQEEFAKYQQTPQYQKLNVGMLMGSIFEPGTFKFIYFWEYLHRLWARMMGFVFLFPFVFFLVKKWIPIQLQRHLLSVIGLSMLAATFGWIMVASGLVNRPWVNAYKLAIHLCIGIGVFVMLWWAFLHYNYQTERRNGKIFKSAHLTLLITLVVLQIFLGGVMSGTKASLFINTWPDYHGSMSPEIIFNLDQWSYANFNNYEDSAFLVSLIQFLHRNTAYIITVLSAYFLIKRKYNNRRRSYYVYVGLLGCQVLLGILTLVKSLGIIPVFWGVLHQAFGVFTLSAIVAHYFFRKRDYALLTIDNNES